MHLTGEPQSDAQVRSVQRPLLKHSLPPGPGAVRAVSCDQSSSTSVSGVSRDGCDGDRDVCPPWPWCIMQHGTGSSDFQPCAACSPRAFFFKLFRVSSTRGGIKKGVICHFMDPKMILLTIPGERVFVVK